MKSGTFGADGVDYASDLVAGDARELDAGPMAFFGERVAVAHAARMDADADMVGTRVREFFFYKLERTAGGGYLHGTAFYGWHGQVFSCGLDEDLLWRLQSFVNDT